VSPGLRTDVCLGAREALKDSREIAQVEHVVEFGGRREHLCLGSFPEVLRQRGQLARCRDNLHGQCRHMMRRKEELAR